MSGCYIPRTAARYAPTDKKSEVPWGLHTAINLYGCDPLLIRDAEVIRHYVKELCELIEMKRFGETQVVHFGEDENVAGYSMVQLIETSLISGHFANAKNNAYLDIFSCKNYDSQKTYLFTKDYFAAKNGHFNVIIRP